MEISDEFLESLTPRGTAGLRRDAADLLGPVSSAWRDHDRPRRSRHHLAPDINRRRRYLCRLDIPVQRNRGPGHNIFRTEHTRVFVVAAHLGALVDRRYPAPLAPSPGRRLAYAGAY